MSRPVWADNLLGASCDQRTCGRACATLPTTISAVEHRYVYAIGAANGLQAGGWDASRRGPRADKVGWLRLCVRSHAK